LGIRVCECDADDYDGDDDEEAKAQAKATATYIAAANPQAILSLIERLETLEAERKGTVRLTLEQARALEWAGCSACADEGTSCLWCEEPHSAGHDSRCWLAAAIKDATK